MSIGSKIAQYRKEYKITQDGLAQLLNVTNQAVSKWESDQCCPDIQMLPKLADVFGVSIDALFERETTSSVAVCGLPWADDETVRVVLYLGHQLMKNSKNAGDFVFRYEGAAKNISSAVNVSCGDVKGNITAGANVACGNVEGDITAGANVDCGNVGGDIDAGAAVNCGNVDGDVDAGMNVTCGNVGGDVDSGHDVFCSDIQGDVDAGGTVTIQRN